MKNMTDYVEYMTMLYGQLMELNVVSKYIETLLSMNDLIVLIKLQLKDFFYFFIIKIIALDGQSVIKFLTSNCPSV